MGVFIGLGSNLGDGPAMIRAALDELRRHPGVRVKRVSSFYRTAPRGRTDQPDFTNAVAELETSLEPEQLLQTLLDCEAALGRDRVGGRWGPRRIDLDLLCFGEHRLLELEPEFQIPGIGRARACLDALEPQRVTPIE
jgi:2-amino-4-hydroxy-6-hydroxymethyldihydropteridine diphosphokinase